MGKIFEVDGIANITLVYRGSILKPNTRFKVNMNEKEFNCFKDYIDIIDCSELGATEDKKVEIEEVAIDVQKSEPQVEENKDEEVKKDDKPRVRVNSKNKK